MARANHQCPGIKKKDILFGATVVIATIVILICLQIEWLNKAADGYLPHIPDTKWRDSTPVSEEMWRRQQRYSKEDETLLTRPLTESERLQMQKDIEQANTMNALKGSVSGYGMLQYILAPVAFILSIMLVISRRPMYKRIICALFALSSLIAMVLMFYRGYFTSLG